MGEEEKNNQNQLMIPHEILPSVIPVIPLSQRPIFPGMMIPLVLTGETMIDTASEILESDNKIGGVVLIEHQHDGHVDSSDLYKVGVAIKIIKVNPVDEKTIQIMINAIGRFTLDRVIQDEPVIKWDVAHMYDSPFVPSEEMKAYSMAIISAVKDLIKSNSLFQEELKLFLNRFSVEDPGKLADFVASMTSADSRELQEVLETFNVKQRVEKVLILLRKEIELSKLQKKIQRQIEDRMSKQQKEFFLREQLKEIKKELGLEKDEKTTEIEKFEERIQKIHLSEEAAR
nr:LON peptidase substrate-binding domain-containing protein [Spirochaetota bacterium]